VSRTLLLSAVLVVGSLAPLNAQTFQALRGTSLNDWNGSQILSEEGTVLTTISIKNGKLDFSRAAGQTRADLLKSLYKAGASRVFITVPANSKVQFLRIRPDGHIGLDLLEGDLFQALHETADGFALSGFESSSIVDAGGKVIAGLALHNRRVTLALGPGQSFDAFYELGLRSFFTSLDTVAELVKDDQGTVVLKEK
jgi:hypothetical protein